MARITSVFITTTLLSLGAGPLALGSTLTGETSRPESSIFAAGEPVQLMFTAAGLAPGTKTTLSISYRDADGRTVDTAVAPVIAGADGTWTGNVDAPRKKLGFYRVFASLADGATLPKVGSRHDGYLTYAVVPAPNRRVDYGEDGSMFGMQGGFSEKVNVLPYLGARWVLGAYGWGSLESDHRGEYRENEAAALAKGQQYPPKSDAVESVRYDGRPWHTYVLPSLNGSPTWANVPGTTGTSTAVLNPVGEAAWKEFCSEIARAYARNYPDLPQHDYQVTWEPVYPWGFKGTDQQLIEIYKIAYPALHAADPKALVFGPTGSGIGAGDVSWNATLLHEGLGKYIDGLSIHPYFGLPPEKDGLVDEIDALKEAIRKETGKNLPIIGTEQGFATKEDPALEIVQAQGLIRENLIMLGEGFRFNFAFYVADYPGEPGYGYFYNLNPHIDFGTDKVSPKPVAAAYAAMTSLIDGHRPTEKIDGLGSTSMGYAFQRRSDVVLALWDYGTAPNRVTIPVGSSPVTLYDWMGNPSRMSPSASGSVDLTLGPEPVYVTGVSPTLWGSTARRPLVLKAGTIAAFPGETVTIPFTAVSTTGKKDRCRIDVTPDARLHVSSRSLGLTVGAKPVGGAVSFEIPSTLSNGRYDTRLAMLQGDKAVEMTGVTLDVMSPIALSRAVPELLNGEPAIKVDARNRTKRPLDLIASLGLAGQPAGGDEKRTLAPGQSVTLHLPCGSLRPRRDRLYSADVTVKTASGFQTTQTFPVDFAFAPFAASAPSLDAALTDWSTSDAVVVQGKDRVVRSPQYFNPALQAAVKYVWNAQGLFLAFDVTDPAYVQDHTGFDTWKGDCLQLEFDLDPDRVPSKTGNLLEDAGQDRATEIDLALTKDGPQAYRTITYSAADLPVRQLTASELPLRVVKTGSGLEYRAEIPWATLGAKSAPKPGSRIGFAGYVNDMQRSSQLDPSALGLYVDSETTDPAEFGQLTLLGPTER